MKTSSRIPWSCAGFTVIELVVGISIVGMLVALLLPAVQSARASASLTRCRSQLHELGGAMLNYEETHRRLPPAAPRSLSRGQSALVEILPQIDQMALHSKLIREPVGSMTTFSREDGWPAAPVVMQCPSDPAERGANYRLNDGPDISGPQVGVISYFGLPLSEVTDGLSQTALMSETLKSPLQKHDFMEADIWWAGDPGLQANESQLISLCTLALTNPVPAYHLSGQFWQVQGLIHSNYNHVVGPNFKLTNCYFENVPLPSSDQLSFYSGIGAVNGIMPARSHHVGGVNLLKLDGSVRFVANEINLLVWQALSTINGNEITEGF